MRSRTEGKLPRWIACFSMMENQTSTRVSQDPRDNVFEECQKLLVAVPVLAQPGHRADGDL